MNDGIGDGPDKRVSLKGAGAMHPIPREPKGGSLVWNGRPVHAQICGHVVDAHPFGVEIPIGDVTQALDPDFAHPQEEPGILPLEEPRRGPFRDLEAHHLVAVVHVVESAVLVASRAVGDTERGVALAIADGELMGARAVNSGLSFGGVKCKGMTSASQSVVRK